MALMAYPKFKHIYGPVHSWRIGMSLGVDPISTSRKVCNFNCTYCQLGCSGMADTVNERRVFIPVHDVIDEIRAVDPATLIDYITFSGNGEPTLAANLGEMIIAAKALRGQRTAVITNGALLGQKDVQADLAGADLVLVKLEAADELIFQALNRPAQGITFASLVSGIKAFRSVYKGRFALQIMFVDSNRAQADDIARLARSIGADEVQLNTPLRPSPERPLSPREMADIGVCFAGQNVRSVYDEDKKAYEPFDAAATARRHGKFRDTADLG
jgi:wyosine [tRNA(Phe)-imidazoG37] synthetase (radical SAM superfamily)